MPSTHFIINTLSPHANLTKKEISRHFDDNPNSFTIKLSKYRGHVIELTKASIAEGANIIVACGGDGTVNEVARCLVGTPIIMAVFPIGSGNGLARHLGIPTNLTTAIRLLKQGRFQEVDVGLVNGLYFFSNLSVAFSARVIYCYDSIKKRGKIGYIRAFFKAVTGFQYNAFELIIEEKKEVSVPFILMISNTDQMGYNHSLTPEASMLDGKLDMIRLERGHPLKISIFLIFALFRIFPSITGVIRRKVEHIRISPIGNPGNLQIDGEKVEWDYQVLDIKVLPKALKIMC